MTMENPFHFAPPIAVFIAEKRNAAAARQVITEFMGASRNWFEQDGGGVWGHLFLQDYRLPPNTRPDPVRESIVTMLRSCGAEIRNARDASLEIHATPEAHAKLQHHFGRQLG